MTELDVIKTLIKINPKTQNDLVKAGKKISKLAKLPIFKNNYFLELYHKFLKKGMIKENKYLAQLLTVRKIRSLSGVAIITLATKPFPCPGKCLYCPSQKEMPKSYLNNEPAIMRAMRNKFDPFDQVKERIETLEGNGHNADKLEIIVIGGT
jgi:elongator complex protein 3